MKSESPGQIRLDDLVREEFDRGQSPANPFGFSTEGMCIDPWHMNYQRIRYFGSSFCISDLGSERLVQISVPPTNSGARPLENMESFGWDGKINESVAEMAVWMAFEILDEAEGRDFIQIHKPLVIFRFVHGGRLMELTVRYNGRFWAVESYS